MRLQISHRSTFHYSLPARSNINEVRLTPEQTERQEPGNLKITVDPEPETGLKVFRDLYGNQVHSFEVERKHPHLEVLSECEVQTFCEQDRSLKSLQAELLNRSQLDDREEDFDALFEFLSDSQYVKKSPGIWREALDVSAVCVRSCGAVVEALSNHIFDTCEWNEQLIHRATEANEVRETRQGTCQDFSHLLIGFCRAIEIPARYVSGYVYDPGLESADHKAELVGSEVSHAWVDFYAPGPGWVGIDPTNRCWINEHYVSVARGRDYGDVAPIRGSLLGGGPKRSLDVEVKIHRVDQD